MAYKDIKNSALKKWKEFLRYETREILSINQTQRFFPWYYRGCKENIKDSYADQYKNISELFSNSKDSVGYGYSIVFENVNTRLYGEQQKIKSILVDNPIDFVKLIDKENEYNNFLDALPVLKDYYLNHNYPLISLNNWISSNLDYVTEKKEENFYPSLLLALTWLNENRSSNLYIREIPIEVHTKFIEDNKKTLLSLLVNINALDEKDYKDKDFEEIMGLKKKPLLIRFRMLSNLWKGDEMALCLSNFNSLKDELDIQSINRVFIIENEIVYLTFPLDKNSLVVFGSGFQVKTLEKANWLKEKKVFYFGDLDEHGFEMLALSRSIFPGIESFLMDEETYNKFSNYAVEGKEASSIYDNYLTKDELELLRKLRQNKAKSRLEQERIPLSYIKQKLVETID